MQSKSLENGYVCKGKGTRRAKIVDNFIFLTLAFISGLYFAMPKSAKTVSAETTETSATLSGTGYYKTSCTVYSNNTNSFQMCCL